MKFANNIQINMVITDNQIALVAAGIDPTDVNDEVVKARMYGRPGWERALDIQKILLLNLGAGSLDPEPVAISYCKPYGSVPAEDIFRGINEIVPALKERGAPDKAFFRPKSGWLWIAEHFPEIGQELRERIYENFASGDGSQGCNQLEDLLLTERVSALNALVAELTESLLQAKAEIAEHKAEAPLFRHITPELKLVAMVQERYWGNNWDPNEPDSRPSQKIIIDWVKNDQHISECSHKRAEMIAMVACPEAARR